MNTSNTKKPYFTTEKAGGRWGVVVVLLILCFTILLLGASWMYLWTKSALAIPVLPSFETNRDALAEIEFRVELLEASQKSREML